MRRLIAIVCALVVGVASTVPASAVVITPGDYIGSSGTGESLAGDRFRSFANTGGNENYLGVPSLGNLPRAERGITWTTNTLTSYDFTFQYDQANDKLVSTIAGGTLERPTWSADLITKGKTKGASDLNAFQISIGNRDAGADVYLTDVVLDGIALGGFSTVNPSFGNWLVTGPDMNLTDGFTLTGTLWLLGPFSTSQENSVVNLTAGWDTRGSTPVPAETSSWGQVKSLYR
jgi:hypothetical protein